LKVFEIGGGIRAAAAEHKEAIRSIIFSRDSGILYTGGADEMLAIWDMTSGQVKKKMHDFFMTVGGIAVPPEGTGLVVGDGKKLSVLDEGGTVKKRLKSKAYGIGAARFIPGTRRVAAGSKGGLVEIWDTAGGAGSPEHSMRRHSGAVSCITVESSGRTMLSGGLNRLIVLWDIEKGKPIRVYEGHRSPVTGVQYIPGTEHFASSDSGGWLFVWDKANSKILSKLRVCESGSVASLALSPDGKRLYAALSDGSVAILEYSKSR
jgi:WD40 repeat protein